jgi:hypothetical protein
MSYRYNIDSGLKRIVSKAEKSFYGTMLAIAGLGTAVALPLAAKAAPSSQVVVTPTNTQGWSTKDTRPGGAVNFIQDNTAPGNPHNGALQLTTDATTTAKAQFLHDANTPLASVNELSYSTKQNSASFAEGEASYQLPVNLTGTGGFTTLVYEPYYNGTAVPGQWQSWDVDQGLFWSSRTVACSNGTVLGSPGGPASYTLSQINSLCPNAVVVGFGVNVGSGNPAYNVEADLVNFNGTTYNFEPFQSPSDKDACKNDGYKTLTDQNGQAFKNQGQCVSWTNGRGQ